MTEKKRDRREYMKRWWAKPESKDMYYSARNKRREINRKTARQIKADSGCSRCEEKDPDALDFHHLDPSKKESNITNAVYNYSLKRMLEEIAKCIVLCRNCHQKEHARQWRSERKERERENRLTTNGEAKDG